MERTKGRKKERTKERKEERKKEGKTKKEGETNGYVPSYRFSLGWQTGETVRKRRQERHVASRPFQKSDSVHSSAELG